LELYLKAVSSSKLLACWKGSIHSNSIRWLLHIWFPTDVK
jgi:hypothetical protein